MIGSFNNAFPAPLSPHYRSSIDFYIRAGCWLRGYHYSRHAETGNFDQLGEEDVSAATPFSIALFIELQIETLSTLWSAVERCCQLKHSRLVGKAQPQHGVHSVTEYGAP